MFPIDIRKDDALLVDRSGSTKRVAIRLKHRDWPALPYIKAFLNMIGRFSYQSNPGHSDVVVVGRRPTLRSSTEERRRRDGRVHSDRALFFT